MSCPWSFIWIIPLFSIGSLLIICVLGAVFLLFSGGTGKDLENSDLRSKNPFCPSTKSKFFHKAPLRLQTDPTDSISLSSAISSRRVMRC